MELSLCALAASPLLEPSSLHPLEAALRAVYIYGPLLVLVAIACRLLLPRLMKGGR
jgi:hypothetical protein